MDPSTGTFTTMDTYAGTIFDPTSLHKYLYANANPVMYVDPSGYASLTDTQVAAVGAMFIAAAIASNDTWAMNVYKNIRSSFASNELFSPKYIFNIDAIFVMQIASGVLTAAEANEEASAEITSEASSGTGAASPSPDPNNKKNNKDEKNQTPKKDNKDSFVKHGRSKPPKHGEPNTVYEQMNPDGTVRSRAFYDEEGRVFNRQDFDHTHFDKITNQDLDFHEHYYKYNEFGKPIKVKPNAGALPNGYNNLPNWF